VRGVEASAAARLRSRSAQDMQVRRAESKETVSLCPIVGDLTRFISPPPPPPPPPPIDYLPTMLPSQVFC